MPYPDIFVITDLTVMSIDKTRGRLQLEKLMPGVSFEQVGENTAFKPLVGPEVATVEAPTERELDLLRNQVDPEGAYVKAPA